MVVDTCLMQERTEMGKIISLKDRDWKDFYLADLFKPVRGNQNRMSYLEAGNIPLVSARNVNNGYKDYVEANKGQIYPGDILTLNNDGEGGAGIAYFQPVSMYLDTHCTALFPLIRLDKYQLLFISTCITKQRSKFGHGYSLSNQRLSIFKLMLPVDSKGSPDLKFMGDYMRAKERDLLLTYRNYLQVKDDVYTKRKPSAWKPFKMEDMFYIYPGKRLTKSDMVNGKRPFVGATDSNNGITNWVGNINDSLDRNVIGVNYNGSVGEAFYHPYECIFSDDVKRLHLKHGDNTKYVSLFIKACILSQKKVFSYGYKFNGERMNRHSIVLPVTEKGSPDWEYMDSKMRQVEHKLLEEYINRKL